MLKLYFKYFLKYLAAFPPPYAYLPLRCTGHLFRNWDDYSGGVLSRQALRLASTSLQEVFQCSAGKANAVVADYLRFESRFVLENFWIKNQQSEHIRRAFVAADVERLTAILKGKNAVVVTAHTAGICSLVELLRIQGIASGFVVVNTARKPIAEAEPIHLGMIELFSEWQTRQRLLDVEDGSTMDDCRELLNGGDSVIIASDVPGYANQGVTVPFFGKEVWTPVGAARMARDTGSSIIVVVPVAGHCYQPYKICIQEINTGGDIGEIMSRIYVAFEAAIRPALSCWFGWLFWQEIKK
ncbi:MAG: hypothetical protein DRH04_10965 [Deltaproteobacteria bacterium]|nr:MAG: hypothetical protein DRH04_10965 [Deltaproteobacteria bacterium]